MDADRHHLRVPVPGLSSELVERSLAQLEKVLRRRESWRAEEAAVVVNRGVRYDEVLATLDMYEIRQIVVVGVRVVEKAAFLDEQFPRAHAWAERTIRSHRASTAASGYRSDGPANPLTLLVAAE